MNRESASCLPQHPSFTSLCRLQHRFMFMGILNAVFAPFIVLYLLMYSFFRYFEASYGLASVLRLVLTCLTDRNTTRIPQLSAAEVTRPLQDGSSANSMNFPMSLNAGWMRAIPLRSNTSISSPRRLQPLPCGKYSYTALLYTADYRLDPVEQLHRVHFWSFCSSSRPSFGDRSGLSAL